MKRLGLLFVFVILCSSGDAQSIKSGYKLTVESGTTNTGNAAVTDVALGKTFSSSVLTNATGTSTKNATVPGGAPILPVQAFVDCMPLLYTDSDTILNSGVVLSNKSITHFDAKLIYTTTNTAGFLFPSLFVFYNVFGLDLSGNAIPTSEINAILAAAAHVNIDIGSVGPVSNGSAAILTLTGGTNGAPTGQGLTDKQTLIDAGWTVTTN